MNSLEHSSHMIVIRGCSQKDLLSRSLGILDDVSSSIYSIPRYVTATGESISA